MASSGEVESEFNDKINDLVVCLNAQQTLHNKLSYATKKLKEIVSLLEIINMNLISSNEKTKKLQLENQTLKLTCDEWMKRAIDLEFKLLKAVDAAKK